MTGKDHDLNYWNKHETQRIVDNDLCMRIHNHRFEFNKRQERDSYITKDDILNLSISLNTNNNSVISKLVN